MIQESQDLKYMIFGNEVGESGTPHLQGLICWSTCKTMQAVKDAMDLQRLHLEPMMGTFKQAEDYCKKDGDWINYGTPLKQGARKDLEIIQEQIKDGVDEVQIAEEHFGKWVVYRRSFAAYRNLINQGQDRSPPEVKVLWGPTGTGKTRAVHQALGTLWTWPGGQWFDGFNGQDNALFDDFAGELPFRQMLRLLDRYSMMVPIKGDFVQWTPKTIWITSNLEVEQWYPFENCAPLLRRIHSIEHIT